ncbi:MAG: hypothetical protein ACMXX8_03665, partial [Candidatus Woesearchaeota archaeon]
KIILVILFIVGIIITQRLVFYIYRGSTFFNLLGPLLMILVILYIIITAIINKISLIKTIKEIFKIILISLCLSLLSILFITGIYWVIISNNSNLQLIVISILIFLIGDIILIFDINKINPKKKRNLIKKILKFLNIAIIIIIILILISLIFLMVYEIVKPRPRWIHDQRWVPFENIPHPTYQYPISLESTRINVRKNYNENIGLKILNTLHEKANNLTIYSENCGLGILSNIAKEPNDDNFVIAKYIEPGEVIEHIIIINAKDINTREIMLCDLIVQFNGENDYKINRLSLQIIIE